MKIKINTVNILLGLALGTGYLTSLRFAGLIGVSELLFFIVATILIKKNHKKILNFPNNTEGFIRIYFLFSSIIILPLSTLIIFIFGTIESSAPIYVASFIFSIIFTILVIEEIRSNQINMKTVTSWFALTFIITNFISIFVFNLDTDESRYTGGAKNPNQLLFYASTLSLLIIIYQKQKAFILFPIIVFIMLKTGSDAYILSLVAMTAVFFYLKLIFFLNNTSLFTKILGHTFILTPILLTIIFLYHETISDIWLNADEGDARRYLMWNALLASLQSPLFGWGAGSFSGVSEPFQGFEAHNTFLDLAMSFGLIFPAIIYAIFFATLFKSIKNNEYLVSAFIVGFIISGLFHFSGRHFAFWIEVAVFMVYLFPKHTTLPKETTNPCAASQA